MNLHLVLVEPRGARNVGSVARLCANFGVDSLRLVAPRCEPLSEEARQMAVHGVHHLERAEVHEDLASALADCQRVVAATGRLEAPPLPLRSPAEALAWLLAPDGDPPPEALAAPRALVFGREDRGLSNGELLTAGCLLHIPAAAVYPSLNLSHAVAVALHHLWTLRQGPAGAPAPPLPAPAAPLAERGAVEATLRDAEALLLEVGFLLPHTARARMAKVKALLQRAQLTENDVALLRGMVCQLRWASRRGGREGEGH
ncbi:MAG: TrmJ/YjtD family RNA methyltransferase [Cyanobacteria bacterium K_Offshore_surface_m2_239]|nr:TrmJ/YjtD family RNA methyltransferase [Cyanobacteria bacterium K_Offshore_surface_m2_239]